MTRRNRAESGTRDSDLAWRDPSAVVMQWHGASDLDPGLLRHRVSGAWWETLERLGVTLLISHEYDHFLVALSVQQGRPRTSHLPMPHPSGIAFDPASGSVHVASTRNPNQIFELLPSRELLDRADVDPADPEDAGTLLPARSNYYPGSLYLHDLAIVDSKLHGNAVGHNAIVRFSASGAWERAWWPRSIEADDGPDFARNHLQLNSIGARRTLADSVFTASVERPGRRKPGHRNFAVDGRGVVFSGRTREPIARGLTRPHSARWHQGQVWLDDSGYGRVVVMHGEGVETVTTLSGWTRGLAFVEEVAFVGTSRVIPRFRAYAPGLDVETSVCAVHAIDTKNGALLGSITWPQGNQIFAIEPVPLVFSVGFPLTGSGPAAAGRLRRLFYSYDLRARRNP